MNYLPYQMTFDRSCVEWCWDNIHTLRRGEWPGGIPSDYTEVAGVARGTARAHFETAVFVACEVEIRAARCGSEGYLVEEKYIVGLSEEEIARKRHLDVDYVYRAINKVLGYSASGRNHPPRDKETQEFLSYEEWKRRVRNKRTYRG